MFDSLDVYSVSAVATIPIIVALVQAIKMVAPAGKLDKWSPLIALAIGVIASFFANHDVMDAGEMVMSGIVYGLSASGLYSGTKTTAHAVKSDTGKSDGSEDI